MNDLLASVLRASQHRFIGRLARDPEIRFFDNGNSVANVRMAVNKPGAKRDDGQEPDWFKLELWGDQAQAFADSCTKGSLVDVTGRVKTETWKDRTTGEERRALTVQVENWELVQTEKKEAQKPATAKTAPDWFSSDQGSEDDIPF
jgi:single-strand DNA-binding protein